MTTSTPTKAGTFRIVTVLALGLLIIGAILYFKKPEKTGFVNSGIILEKYQGMIDARAQFKKKTDVWQSNTDTLSSDLQRGLMDYEKSIASMNPREKKLNEELLQSKQKQLMQYQQATQRMAQEEEVKVTRGPLNQINAYITEYGKKHGFKYILGTANGNILYVDTTYNLTDDILKGLNEQYNVGKK